MALTESYRVFQRAAVHQEPSYQVKGVLTDGFDSTTKSLRMLFLASAWAPACATRSTNSLTS